VIIDRNYPESALLDLLPAVPRFTADERREAVRQAQPIYHAFGTTSIYEGHGCAPVVIAQYRELHELGQLSMRTGLVVNPVIRSIEDARRMFADWLPHARGSGIGDATLRVTGIHVPFGGDPTVAALAARDPTDVSWSGYVKQAFSPPQFEALAMLAAQHGLRLHTVASDRVDEILPILERVDAAYPLAGRRWVLEHLSRTRPESIARIRRLGLLVTVIPAYHVWKVGDRYRSLDEQAQQGVVPVRQLLDAGVPVAAGTDAVPADPLFTVWAMVTRATRGSAAPLGAALRLMTVAGAALTYDEQRKGPLAPGYFADLTVLSEDPRVVEVDRIPQLRRIATMVGGRFVAGEPAD
jgi:predicted amidohydrolase YtcJ